MFDIGWLELLTLAVLAVLVVGPRDLPRLMRGVGRFVARARAMARRFQAEFDDMAKAADLENLGKDSDGFLPPPPVTGEGRQIAPDHITHPPDTESQAEGGGRTSDTGGGG